MATGLDPRFFLLAPLQEVLFDRDTGEPLSSGIVTFYEDNNRTVLKPIYQLSGSPPYSESSYVPLNNPINLTSIGTFADNNGNDIVPYLFPYDGTLSTTTNTIDLYFITVYSSAGVFQFSREAWPNTTLGSINPDVNNEIINYIPNGQFLLHNTVPLVASNVTVPADNGTSADVSSIAQGGWTFQVPHGTSSVNTISFITQTPDANPDITADPRNVLNVACTSASAPDAYKDVCIEFPDVNKFSSSGAIQYTFSFQAVNVGAALPVEIRLLKFFGTGGSPSTSTDMPFGAGTLTIAAGTSIGGANTIYNISGTFGSNVAATLGTNNDDYLQIAVRFPTNIIFNSQLCNFILTNGEIELTGFPQTPNSDFLDRSTVGWLPTPNPDGSNLYLPFVLTQEGAIYDDSGVASIVSKMTLNAENNELLCDGTQYSTTGYSPLGIPYSRLFNKLFNNGNTLNVPLFNTGATFVNALINSGNTAEIVLSTNQTGLQTNPVDGGVPTGFTFGLLTAGGSAVGFVARTNNTSGIVIANSTFITATHNNLGFADFNTGMTIGNYNSPSIGNYTFIGFVTAIAAASLAAGAGQPGLYFVFSSGTTDYFIWFQVTTETLPTVAGRTGIKVKLDSTMAVADVSNLIANALSQFQSNLITVGAASTITQSSFFTFNANSVTYTVWYNKAGGGTAPSASNLIEVNIGSSDTAAVVATQTQIAINSQFFAVPDLRGMFFRGAGISSTIDLDEGQRYGYINSIAPSYPGSFEVAQIEGHQHNFSTVGSTPANFLGTAAVGSTTITVGTVGTTLYSNPVTGVTSVWGVTETRPINAYVNYFIKY